MKKFRQRILEMKEGFLTAKMDEAFPAYMFANSIFILSIFIIICIISAIIYSIFKTIGICMITINVILLLVFRLSDRAFSRTIPISYKIFTHIFGRYGLVVTKNDWKRIKKKNKNVYRIIWDKKNKLHCYAIAWLLGLYLKDAKIMYCSVAGEKCKTAHAVIVKNNCIYDTTERKHYDFDEYIQVKKAEVYKIFEKEVYGKKSFFDDVRQDFVNWCAERDVYCNPQ